MYILTLVLQILFFFPTVVFRLFCFLIFFFCFFFFFFFFFCLRFLPIWDFLTPSFISSRISENERTKGCILLLSEKGDLGITKNYKGITLSAIAAKVYNALLLNGSFWSREKRFSEKLTYNFSDPDNSSNHRRNSCKQFRGSTIVYRFLLGIRFLTQR